MKKAKKQVSSQDVLKLGYGPIKTSSNQKKVKKQVTPRTSSTSTKNTVTPNAMQTKTKVTGRPPVDRQRLVSKVESTGNKVSGLAKSITKPTTTKYKKTQTSRTAPTMQNTRKKKLY